MRVDQEWAYDLEITLVRGTGSCAADHTIGEKWVWSGDGERLNLGRGMCVHALSKHASQAGGDEVWSLPSLAEGGPGYVNAPLSGCRQPTRLSDSSGKKDGQIDIVRRKWTPLRAAWIARSRLFRRLRGVSESPHRRLVDNWNAKSLEGILRSERGSGHAPVDIGTLGAVRAGVFVKEAIYGDLL